MLLSSFPSSIIIINNDLSPQVQSRLISQLKIDEIIDGYTFDTRVNFDPDYLNTVKYIEQRRVMVIRPLNERQNIDQADIVAFVSHGLLSVQCSKFGPPGATFPVKTIHWGQMGVYVKKIGPGELCCSCCGYNFYNPVRAQLDELNRRICACSACSSCCKCKVPTYRTLLVPNVRGIPVGRV